MGNPDPVPNISRRSALAALALAPAALTAAAGPAVPAGVNALSGCIKLPTGRSLGFADFGDRRGPLVLYFHGLPGSRLEATLVAEEAAEWGVRLVGGDRPGIGLSSPAPGRSILSWPADAAFVADALGYAGSSFGVVGVSGGAPYALAMAKCLPERLTHTALVAGQTPLADPRAPRGNQSDRIHFFATRPRLARIALKVIIRRLQTRPDRVLERVIGESAPVDRQLLLGDAANRAGFLASLRAAARRGPEPVLAEIRLLARPWGYRLAELPPLPISIWHGGCDPIAPPSMGHYFHAGLAGSELRIDPRAGHATMLKWHARDIFRRFA
ncbi:MAG TPA: alpha/beta hydrolase [Lacipirellulaceae bacterium]|nr:alpha/beta hydrolase [Lacipirellulaceae bacterium]